MRKINPVCSLIAAGCLLAAGCKPVEPNAVVQANMLTTESAAWNGDFEYLEYYFPIRPGDQVILTGPNKVRIIVNNSIIDFLVSVDSCTTVINRSSGFVVVSSEKDALYYQADKSLDPGDSYVTATSPKINGSVHKDTSIPVEVIANTCRINSELGENQNDNTLVITDKGSYFIKTNQ